MDISEIERILNTSPLTLVEKVKLETRRLRGMLGEAEELEKPTIGPDGEEILEIIEESSFDEWERDLVQVLSKIAIPGRKDAIICPHPKTGQKGWWVPSLYFEPNLLEVYSERKEAKENRLPNSVDLPIGSAIVLPRRDNLHSYPIGEPIIVLKKVSDGLFTGIFPDPEGKSWIEGNFFPVEKGTFLPAREEEIDLLPL